MNVLITSAGRRVSLVREFQFEVNRRFGKGKVFACDLNPQLSPACQISDGYFQVPPVDHNNYIEKLTNICLENKIGIIIPTIDPELLIFANNKVKLLEKGIRVIISDPTFISMCRDKRLTHQFFDEYGITRAEDIDMEHPSYPIFVKPFDGSCSVGTFLIQDKAGLVTLDLGDPKNMYLEYFDQSAHNEFTVDMYYNRKSELTCCIPRRRIEVRSGEVNKGVTQKNFLVTYIYEKLKLVPGVFGCINLQVFVNVHTQKVIGVEINPRFGGGYPLSYFAGGNFPKWIIDEYIDGINIEYSDKWEDKLLLLRYDEEVIIQNFEERN
jgi:carbamoyl-phosphate synthase large subunit